MVLVADSLRVFPHKQMGLWESAFWISSGSFAGNMSDLSIQVLSDLGPQELVGPIHFVIAVSLRGRLDTFAVVFVIHFGNAFILRKRFWGNERASLKRCIDRSRYESVVVFRHGREVLLYVLLLPWIKLDMFSISIVMFGDQGFLD